jgi:hypothetical protein
MSLLAEPLAALIAAVGYGRAEPVIVGVHRLGRAPFAAQGMTGAGEPLGPATLAYGWTASCPIMDHPHRGCGGARNQAGQRVYRRGARPGGGRPGGGRSGERGWG